MTATGVTLVPEEPDGLEPAGHNSAPPAPEKFITPEETPAPEEPVTPEETPTPEEPVTSGGTPVPGQTPTFDETLAPEHPITSEETRPAEDLDDELRGSLTVAKRVVQKIAEQAAMEVTGDGAHRSAYAVQPGATVTARPTVDVQLEGADAWVTVDVGLTYPTPLRAAADELRAHLVERLEQLSGVTVKRLDIRISWLGATAKQPRWLR